MKHGVVFPQIEFGNDVQATIWKTARPSTNFSTSFRP